MADTKGNSSVEPRVAHSVAPKVGKSDNAMVESKVGVKGGHLAVLKAFVWAAQSVAASAASLVVLLVAQWAASRDAKKDDD